MSFPREDLSFEGSKVSAKSGVIFETALSNSLSPKNAKKVVECL